MNYDISISEQLSEPSTTAFLFYFSLREGIIKNEAINLDPKHFHTYSGPHLLGICSMYCPELPTKGSKDKQLSNVSQ